MKAELTCLSITLSTGNGVANDWNAKPGLVRWSGDSLERDECATWIIICGDGEDGGVADSRARYVGRREVILDSKFGLLREGPQYVGCVKASWISIKRRAVLWESLADNMLLM